MIRLAEDLNKEGYNFRPKAFPHSLCMIGLKDIRDYRIYSDASKAYIVGGAAFNIKEKSIRLQFVILLSLRALLSGISQKVSSRNGWWLKSGLIVLPESLSVLYRIYQARQVVQGSSEPHQRPA